MNSCLSARRVTSAAEVWRACDKLSGCARNPLTRRVTQGSMSREATRLPSWCHTSEPTSWAAFQRHHVLGGAGPAFGPAPPPSPTQGMAQQTREPRLRVPAEVWPTKFYDHSPAPGRYPEHGHPPLVVGNDWSPAPQPAPAGVGRMTVQLHPRRGEKRPSTPLGAGEPHEPVFACSIRTPESGRTPHPARSACSDSGTALGFPNLAGCGGSTSPA